MQKHLSYPDVTLITPTAPMTAAVHGGRAKCLQRLIRLEMPVPTTVALSFDAVHGIASGRMPDIASILGHFDAARPIQRQAVCRVLYAQARIDQLGRRPIVRSPRALSG